MMFWLKVKDVSGLRPEKRFVVRRDPSGKIVTYVGTYYVRPDEPLTLSETIDQHTQQAIQEWLRNLKEGTIATSLKRYLEEGEKWQFEELIEAIRRIFPRQWRPSSLTRKTLMRALHRVTDATHGEIRQFLGGERALITVKVYDPSIYAMPSPLFRLSDHIHWAALRTIFRVLREQGKPLRLGEAIVNFAHFGVTDEPMAALRAFIRRLREPRSFNLSPEISFAAYMTDPDSKKLIPFSSWYDKALKGYMRAVAYETRMRVREVRPLTEGNIVLLRAPEDLETPVLETAFAREETLMYMLTDRQTLKGYTLTSRTSSAQIAELCRQFRETILKDPTNRQWLERWLDQFLPPTERIHAEAGLYALTTVYERMAQKEADASPDTFAPYANRTYGDILNELENHFKDGLEEFTVMREGELHPEFKVDPYRAYIAAATLMQIGFPAFLLYDTHDLTGSEALNNFLQALLKRPPTQEDKDGFNHFLTQLRNILMPLLSWEYRPAWQTLLGFASSLQSLSIEIFTNPPYSDFFRQQLLSLVSYNERRIKEFLKVESPTAFYRPITVLIDTTPEGFHALATDRTCFSYDGINWIHRFFIMFRPNSFTVQFFSDGERLGRAWGYLNLDDRNFMVTNFKPTSPHVYRPMLREAIVTALKHLLNIRGETLQTLRSHPLYDEIIGRTPPPYRDGDELYVPFND